ncbi:MAG: hypothetical protein KIT83_22670 [Bryobacterales bacterium]|nr:hypothetical protein [Bryobacterales bacterium]
MMPELTPALIGFVAALLGAGIAGCMGIYAAVKAVDRGFDRLEQQEIRRMKVECVVNMTGARFVLDKRRPNPEDEARFNVELNKIPLLFSDDENVMRAYRQFASNPGKITNLYPMMESLTKAVKIIGVVEQQEFERVLRAGEVPE